MVPDDRKSDTAICRETTEEAAQAIASALEFLGNEARAVGMYDLHAVIEIARATASGHFRQSNKSR
jgi:hypothetical protein